jgi:GDP-fucose transporter C1
MIKPHTSRLPLLCSVEALSFIPPPILKLDICKKVAPLTFIYIGMLCFTNVTIAEVSLSFYQILRAAVIPINAVIGHFFLGVRTSAKAAGMCLVVCVGFTMGSMGEIKFTPFGFVCGCLSAVFCALYSIFVKKVLPHVDGSTWALLLYNSVLAILLLGPMVLVLEHPSQWFDHPSVPETKFWCSMILAGVFGLLINFAFFAQLKYCSALTSHISGNTKSAVQSILSMYVFDTEITTVTKASGLFLTVAGSIGYSQVKYMEMKARIEAEERARASENANDKA